MKCYKKTTNAISQLGEGKGAVGNKRDCVGIMADVGISSLFMQGPNTNASKIDKFDHDDNAVTMFKAFTYFKCTQLFSSLQSPQADIILCKMP